jgi:hypothetical protein
LPPKSDLSAEDEGKNDSRPLPKNGFMTKSQVTRAKVARELTIGFNVLSQTTSGMRATGERQPEGEQSAGTRHGGHLVVGSC